MIVEIRDAGRAERLLEIPDADVVRICAGEKEQAGAERLAPMRCGSKFVGGDVGVFRGRFAAAVRACGIRGVGRVGNAGEGLAEALVGAVDAEVEGIAVRIRPVAAGGIAEEARAVELIGRAVVAQFVEGGGAHEETQRALNVLGHDNRVLTVDVAGNVDRAALEGRLLNVAIGAEHARCREHAPWPKFRLSERAGIVGAFPTVSGGEFGGVGCGANGNDIDDAADGA